MSDRGGRGASVAMIATSWEVAAGCSLSITIRAHLHLVLVCTYAAYHVAGAAIPTRAVWRQQLWSGEVVHLEPPALQTSAVLFSYRVLQSNPPLMAQSTGPSLVLSLPALTAVAVLSLPDYSGRPWEWGQTDPHQPMLGSSLPLGC